MAPSPREEVLRPWTTPDAPGGINTLGEEDRIKAYHNLLEFQTKQYNALLEDYEKREEEPSNDRDEERPGQSRPGSGGYQRIEDLNKRIQRLENDIQDKDATLLDKNAAINEKDATIEELKASIENAAEAHEAQESQLKDHLQFYENSFRKLKTAIDQLLHGATWTYMGYLLALTDAPYTQRNQNLGETGRNAVRTLWTHMCQAEQVMESVEVANNGELDQGSRVYELKTTRALIEQLGEETWEKSRENWQNFGEVEVPKMDLLEMLKKTKIESVNPANNAAVDELDTASLLKQTECAVM